MLKLLCDTCVWMDVAKDPQQQVLLTAVDELLKAGELIILLPSIVRDEFQRNKGKITEHNSKSLSSVLKRVKEIVSNFGDEGEKDAALEQLHKVSQKLPRLGDAAAGSVRMVESLFSRAQVIEVENDIKLRAAERAIQNKAPFHRSKNSIADAIIIETFADCTKGEDSVGHRFAFVTHNIKDFSDPDGDDNNPHPDFAGIFSKRKVRYFIKLTNALTHFNPDVLKDIELDEFELEPRTTDEIVSAINELTDRVWYDRHKQREQGIEEGRILLQDDPAEGRNAIKPSIWAGALKSAKKVEKRYGKENLGPYSKFDWGMINGKLSALRWVLGENWDELYT